MAAAVLGSIRRAPQTNTSLRRVCCLQRFNDGEFRGTLELDHGDIRQSLAGVGGSSQVCGEEKSHGYPLVNIQKAMENHHF